MNTIKPYTYLIKFKPTGQCYYGVRSKNVKLNLLPEEDLMIHYQTSSQYIRELIEQHGIENFEWEIRKTFDTIEQAVHWEARVLRRCKVLENDIWLNKNILGYIPPTDETRRKISEYHTGKPKTAKQIEKIRASNIGKNKGKKRTAEQRQLMSIRSSGTNNPMYGKPCSEDRRKKIGEANRGKKRSEEFKKRLSDIWKSDANPGKNKSLKTRQKLSIALSGKKRGPRSEETKRKIAEALKGIKRGPMSEEHRKIRSLSLKGKPKPDGFGNKIAKIMKSKFTENNPNKRDDLKKSCPHCNGVFGPTNYARWHGDRCKRQ